MTLTISSSLGLIASLRAVDGVVTVLDQIDSMKTATDRWIDRGHIMSLRKEGRSWAIPSSDPQFLPLLAQDLKLQFPMFDYKLT
jgi:hypothetical protein